MPKNHDHSWTMPKIEEYIRIDKTQHIRMFVLSQRCTSCSRLICHSTSKVIDYSDSLPADRGIRGIKIIEAERPE